MITNASAKVLALFTGRALHIESQASGEWWDKSWDTGFYKQPQTGPSWLGYEGFRTDEQADRRFHGGPEKAVCVYPAEHYPYWREALEFPALPYGAFGENLTLEGLTEIEACIGDRYSLGEAVVQVSQPRQPCWKLARRWQVKDLPLQVERTGFTGYYFRALHHGHVQPGDVLDLIERPFPEWTITRCNEVMHHGQGGHEAARALAECPLLSSSWKDGLWLRSEKQAKASSSKRTEQPG